MRAHVQLISPSLCNILQRTHKEEATAAAAVTPAARATAATAAAAAAAAEAEQDREEQKQEKKQQPLEASAWAIRANHARSFKLDTRMSNSKLQPRPLECALEVSGWPIRVGNSKLQPGPFE